MDTAFIRWMQQEGHDVKLLLKPEQAQALQAAYRESRRKRGHSKRDTSVVVSIHRDGETLETVEASNRSAAMNTAAALLAVQDGDWNDCEVSLQSSVQTKGKSFSFEDVEKKVLGVVTNYSPVVCSREGEETRLETHSDRREAFVTALLAIRGLSQESGEAPATYTVRLDTVQAKHETLSAQSVLSRLSD